MLSFTHPHVVWCWMVANKSFKLDFELNKWVIKYLNQMDLWNGILSYIEGKKCSMSEFIVFIKQQAKSTQIVYYFCQDSESYGHFTIPWGHGREYVHGREATMLVGHMTVKTWRIGISFILHTFILYKMYFFNDWEVITYSKEVPTQKTLWQFIVFESFQWIIDLVNQTFELTMTEKKWNLKMLLNLMFHTNLSPLRPII